MKIVESVVEIAAPSSRVWDVLTDFSAYPEWNPFIRSVEGPLEEGRSLRVLIQPPGGKAMRFSPTLRSVQPERELCWKGRFIFPGIFDGEHSFQLHRTEGGTRVVHREAFSGLLVSVMPASFFGNIEAGFKAMNQALKVRAEDPAAR